MVEWEAYLSGGRVMSSRDSQWSDVPGDILVVRFWGPERDGVLWGQHTYGHPATVKDSVNVDDAEFAATLARAQAQRVRPSER